MRTSTRATIGLAVAAMGLVSCSIPEDANPREIVGEARRELNVNVNSPSGVGSGSARIYLVAPGRPGQQGLLRAVPRDVGGTATEAIEALLAGPNPLEQRLLLTSAIPVGIRLRSASINGTVLTLDLHGPLDQLSADAQAQAIGQIVLTVAEIPGIRSVQILLDGRVTDWPTGSGDLRREPLTRFDFPGRAESSQPAYPATPSQQPSELVPAETVPAPTAATSTAATSTATSVAPAPTTSSIA